MMSTFFFCFTLLFAVVAATEKNEPKSTVENERVKKAVIISPYADATYGYNNYYTGVYGSGLYNGARYGYQYGYPTYGTHDDGKYHPGKYDDGKYHPGKYDDGKYYPGKYEKTATVAPVVYKPGYNGYYGYNNGYNYGYNYPQYNYGYNAYYGYNGYPNAYYPYNEQYNKYYHNNNPYLRLSYPYVY